VTVSSKEPTKEEWHYVCTAEFDGKIQDLFHKNTGEYETRPTKKKEG